MKSKVLLLLFLFGRIDYIYSKTEPRMEFTNNSPIQPASHINHKNTKRFRVYGDLRNRFEYIKQGSEGELFDIIRLRTNIETQINNKLQMIFGISSGKGNPASINLSIDEVFDYYPVLNLAAVNYKFNKTSEITAGKMKNPFYRAARTQIMWDNDYNPTGIVYSHKSDSYALKLAGISVNEKNSSTNTQMFAGQFLFKHKTDSSLKLISGMGYYEYKDLKGSEPVFNSKFKGNSDDGTGRYANDYSIVELFTELKTHLSDHPLSMYGNYYRNIDALHQDEAYTLGIKYNKIEKPGNWFLTFAYLDVEADALVGTYNHSNFAGGNTNSSGYIIRSRYGLDKGVLLTVTYFDNQIHDNEQPGNYNRFQLDLTTRF